MYLLDGNKSKNIDTKIIERVSFNKNTVWEKMLPLLKKLLQWEKNNSWEKKTHGEKRNNSIELFNSSFPPLTYTNTDTDTKITF